MDLVFDDRLMEITVGKAVHRKDEAIFTLEPSLEFRQVITLFQFDTSLIGKPQADAECLGRTHSLFDIGDMDFQAVERAPPGFARVDIAAVGEEVAA